MTATDELRRLLDERGVEWHGVEDSTYWGEVLLTRRDGSDPVYKFRAHKTANRLSVHLFLVTPEQAVEATLGSCNCSNSERTSDSDATAERRGDAVEVVRCRDCKYVTDEGYGCKYFSHYEQGASYRWEDVPAEVEPDGFCAWGKRKESE